MESGKAQGKEGRPREGKGRREAHEEGRGVKGKGSYCDARYIGKGKWRVREAGG